MRVPTAWKLAILWGVLILALTSLPGASVPSIPPVPHIDKLAHAGLYLVFGALVARAAGEGRALGAGHAAIVMLGVIAFGAVDEWHQLFIPSRTGSWSDLGADTLGACIGVLAFQAALSRREIRQQ
jgi:VanZ family protein